MKSISNINASWPYESPLGKEQGEYLGGQKGTGKRSVSIPSSCWEAQWKADITQSPEKNHCRFWFLFEKNMDNLAHWWNPLILKGSLVSQCSGNNQSLYNIVSEIPVQLVLSMVKSGSWKFLWFWKQKSYIWWYWRALTMILLSYSDIPGTVLSLFHQFIWRAQEVKLLATSVSWVHHVLPDCSSLKPEPSETSQCLPNEDFGKCHALSIFQKMWACTWQIREGSAVTNIILFESIYVINSWTIGHLFFF